jgi:hypothetical protein
LYGLFSRTIDDPKVKAFLKEELNMVPRKEMTGRELPVNKESFQKNKADVMRAVFNVDQFETENRKR